MGGSSIGNGMPRSESVYPDLRGSHPHPTQRVILFAYRNLRSFPPTLEFSPLPITFSALKHAYVDLPPG